MNWMSDINCGPVLAGILIAIAGFAVGASLQSERFATLCDKKVGFMVGDKIYQCQERQP
jgi:hypothetical protein